MPAPADLAVGLAGVPAGEPVTLDLRLESVVEGVLVSGTVTAPVTGECARCLTPVTQTVTVELTELFAYPDCVTEQTTEEDEVSHLVGDHARPGAAGTGRGGARPAAVPAVPRGLPAGSAPAAVSASTTCPTTTPTPRPTRAGPLSPSGSVEVPRRSRSVAVPKRQMSRSNTRSRRSQWKTSAATLVLCENRACRQPKLPHTVCKVCGPYDGKQVVPV